MLTVIGGNQKDGGGECRVFDRPDYVVLGRTRTRYDQNWVDSNTKAGVAACGWQRPKARPQVLGRSPGAKQLAPARQKRPGLISRVRRGRYAERQRSVFDTRDSTYVRGAIGSCCAGGTARSCR
jgi:hypothetical protein